MEHLLTKIGAGVAGLLMMVSGWFGGDNAGAAVQPVAGSTYTLAGSGLSSSATSITLQSLTLPQTGQTLVDSDFSTTFYVTLEPGNRTRQEIASCTTVTQNAAGTATLSGCIRGLSPITPYTASSTLQFVHAGGSQVFFSDPPQLFNQYAAKTNAELIPGQWTASSTAPWAYDHTFGFTSSSTNLQIPYAGWVFNNFVDVYNAQAVAGVKTFGSFPITPSSAPTTDYQVSNKKYVDDTVGAGAADASATVRGVVELATSAEITAGTATGGTGAALAVTPDQLAISGINRISIFSTTTTANMATATIPVASMPTGNNLRFVVTAPNIVGQATTSADILMAFDGDTTAYKYAWLSADASNSGGVGYIKLINQNSAEKSLRYAEMNISNITGIAKMGTFTGMSAATSTNSGLATIGTGANNINGRFTFNATAKITQMDIWTSAFGSLFATGTRFEIFSY